MIVVSFQGAPGEGSLHYSSPHLSSGFNRDLTVKTQIWQILKTKKRKIESQA